MKHHKVVSSNISSIAFDKGVMHVTFLNGGLYEYQGVTASQFSELREADSIGKHLNGMGIKGVKIETKEEAKA